MKKFLRERRRVILIFAPVAIGLIYFLLCAVNIRQSVWLNESYGAYLTHFDFGSIWDFSAANGHSPLYFFILKIWAHFFGHGAAAMRVLSILFGALAIMFAFLWLKYKYGGAAAIVASFILAISPMMVHYGQEIQLPAMAIMIVFAATYFLQLAIDHGKTYWWIVYGLLITAGMWTHYLCALAWLAHIVYLFVIYGKKILRKDIVMTYLLAIILSLPCLVRLTIQTAAAGTSAASIASYWSEMLVYTPAGATKGWVMVPCLITAVVMIGLAIHFRKKIKLLISMSAIPTFLLMLLSMSPFNLEFAAQSVSFAMAAFYLLEGVIIVLLAREMTKPKKARKKKHFYRQPILIVGALTLLIVGNAICGLSSVYAYGNYDFVTNKKPTTKDLYDNIVALDNYQGSPIIANTEWLYYDLSAYVSEDLPVLFIDESVDYKYGVQEPLKQSYFGKIADLDKYLEEHSAFWYVGIEPKNGAELDFPRTGWYITTRSDLQFDEHGDRYQILKLEKEQI